MGMGAEEFVSVFLEPQGRKQVNDRVWITGATWQTDEGFASAASWPLVQLRLGDAGGSLRCSLPGFLGRLFELFFYGPNIQFKWSEVLLVENVVRFVGFHGVRFKLMQQGEPKMFVLTTPERTIADILDFAQARGANVSHLKRRLWRLL